MVQTIVPGVTETVPDVVPAGWVKFGDSIYKLDTAERSWSNAEAQAVAEGGHLVAINSAAENEFIKAEFLSQKAPIHIGLTDTAVDGTFVWSNGDPITYDLWTHAQAPNGVQDGAAMFKESFTNGDFNDGVAGDTTISGWTIKNEQVKFGTDQIANSPTPTDATPIRDSNTPSDWNPPSRTTKYETALDASVNDGSGNSVRLKSSGMKTAQGWDVVRGPYMYSNSTVVLEANDTVSFEWKAEGGDDAFDVYGYIVDVNNGNIQTILDKTGTSTGATTTWATETINVTTDGQYRFVFVSGTYDFSGGKLAGAQLYLDNLKTTRANPPTSGEWDDLPITSPGTGVIEKAAPNTQVTHPDTLVPIPTIIRSDKTLADVSIVSFADIADTFALAVIDQSIADVSEMASSFGAYQNRMESIISGLMNEKESTVNALSRIKDTDMAIESANLIKESIMQQARVAILVQANQQSDTTLQLLK